MEPQVSPTAYSPRSDGEPRVAFATWFGSPQLSDDDRLAADACRASGILVEAQAWDQPCDWRRYDAVVVRSAWNYHLHPQLFAQWVRQLEGDGIPLWNPPRVIAWNMHKRYLAEIRCDGVRTPDTIVVSRGAGLSLQRTFAERGWHAAVVKPAISASAFQTIRITCGEATNVQPQFDASVAERDLLVQEFMPEIAGGELSLIFIQGRFSHAVRKRPAHGEFRVQESLGGTVERCSPDPVQIERCRRVLTQLPAPTLYARVDGIPLQDAFVLLEVEVIEPSLFLSLSDGGARDFAHALLAALQGDPRVNGPFAPSE